MNKNPEKYKTRKFYAWKSDKQKRYRSYKRYLKCQLKEPKLKKVKRLVKRYFPNLVITNCHVWTCINPGRWYEYEVVLWATNTNQFADIQTISKKKLIREIKAFYNTNK